MRRNCYVCLIIDGVTYTYLASCRIGECWLPPLRGFLNRRSEVRILSGVLDLRQMCVLDRVTLSREPRIWPAADAVFSANGNAIRFASCHEYVVCRTSEFLIWPSQSWEPLFSIGMCCRDHLVVCCCGQRAQLDYAVLTVGLQDILTRSSLGICCASRYRRLWICGRQVGEKFRARPLGAWQFE